MASRVVGLVACVLFGCGQGGAGSDPSETEATGASETGSSETGTAGTEGDDTPPTISDLRLTPNPLNHLSATVELDTDEAARVSLTISNDSDHEWTLSAERPDTHHRFIVVGMRTEEEYGFSVVATDASDNEARDDSLAYTAPALPDDFPPIEVTSQPRDMAPGYTLFGVVRWDGIQPDPDWGLILAVDDHGRVVWYHRAIGVGDIRMSSTDSLIFTHTLFGAHEIDGLGKLLAEWTPDGLRPATDTFHHELFEMPDASLLTLSSELEVVDGYPDGMGNISYPIVGDVIVHFDRDGTVRQQWSVLDLLAAYKWRVLDGFDEPFWNTVYADEAPGGTKDWSHGNAVIYDEKAEHILVSLRHQDWIVAFERTTGALAWRLGYEGDFSLVGGTTWFYHQHAPELQSDGSLLIYDNGNGRPGTGFLPADDPPYSRAVELVLDTTGAQASWTATQTWEYVHDSPDVFAPFLGDADRLPNGNVLIADGGLVADGSLQVIDPQNQKFARIIEVTEGDPAGVVFELEIRDSGPAAVSYSVYRAERIPYLPAAQ